MSAKARKRTKAPPVAERPRAADRAARAPRRLVDAALEALGEPLDARTRAYMEERLGHSFAHVRVHTDGRAAEAARALGAEAFTRGSDIGFAGGRYAPATHTGRRLIAHELVHTLQQGRSRPVQPQAFREGATRADPLEREADATADRVAAGDHVPAGAITHDAPEARGDEVPDSPEAVAQVGEELEELLAQDPEDVFGRVTRRLGRLAPDTRRALLAQLGGRLPAIALTTLRRALATLAGPQEGAEATEPATAPRDEAAETARREEAELAAQLRGETPAGLEEQTPDRAAPARDEAAQTERGEEAELAAALGAGQVRPGAPAPGGETTAEPSPDAAATAAGPETEEVEGEAPVPELEGRTEPEEPVAEAAPAEVAERPRPAAPAGPPPTAAAATEAAGLESEGGSVPESEIEAESPEEDGGAPGEPEGEEVEVEAEPESSAEPAAEPAAAAETEAAEEPPGAERAVEEEEAPEAEPPAQAETGPDLAAEEPGAEAEAAEEAEGAPAEGATGDAAAAMEGEGEAAPTAEGSDLEGMEGEGDDGGEPPVGGGVSGVPIEPAPEPETPDVSNLDPADAMGQVANLPPAQLPGALGGVAAASSRTVGEEQRELAATPPQVERPSGAPSAAERAAEEREVPAVPSAPGRVRRAPEGPAVPTPAPPPLPALPPSPTAAVRAPTVAGGPQGALGEDGARELQQSLDQLPTTDPALSVTAGPPPRVALEGNADPEQAREQRRGLDQAAADARAEGVRDVAAPMGESGMYPAVPAETLRADIPAGAGTPAAPARAAGPGAGSAAGGAAGGGGGLGAAASVVAREERGEEIRAAALQAQGDMVARRTEQRTTAQEERGRAQQQIADAVSSNAEQQRTERRTARSEVADQRGQWDEGQRQLGDRAREQAEGAGGDAAGRIERARISGEQRAAQHVETGNRDVVRHRGEAEAEARRQRERGRQETSDGVLGWIASQARSFFDGIKNAISQAFEAARAAVRDAIERAQRFAAQAIDAARNAIVSAIRWVGDRLIEIGDVLLAGFPGLRDRFRRAIRDRVQRAVNRVNQLADALKEGVQRALNFLGAALDAALGLLERGLLAAVDAVNNAVQGAIRFARSVVQGFAAFAALIRDVAVDPIAWLRNLGAAIVDGIRNHLWRALKRAVKRWFNEKIEAILGLGRLIWQLLTRGGIAFAAIGRMVWAALKRAIPVAMIKLLVEKLVAMIVPAVGAIMTIIEGLRAAWGTVSRILQAFERFFIFLRAVKTGRAGPQFAEAVAAAAVAVIDFVANWLLMRLRRPAGAVAGRIRAIAQRIGKRLGRLTRGLVRGVRRGFRRLRARFRRRRGARRPRRQNGSQKAQERLARAQRELPARIDALLRGGVSGFRLKAQLLLWRVTYGLRRLYMRRESEGAVSVEAVANPSNAVKRVCIPRGQVLRRIVHEVSGEILSRRDVLDAAQRMRDARTDRPSAAVPITGAAGFPGAVEYFRARGGRVPRWGHVQRYDLGTGRLPVSESQRRGAMNALVREAGTYPEIRQSLGRTMRGTGMSERRVADAIRTVVAGGRLPPALRGHERTLGGVTMLMFGREAARNPAMVAMAPMTLQLVSRGGLTWQQALSGSQSVLGGGAYPMSMQRAQRAARGLQAEGQGRPPSEVRGGSAAERRELARREIALAERWLHAEMVAAGLEAFRDLAEAKDWIRRKILAFYGLR